MRLLIRAAVTALAVLLLGCGAYAHVSLLSETEYSILMREVEKARLGRIALVVQRESGGRSRLLLSSGEGASPSLGMVVRAISWGDMPTVRVYRVSEPFDTDAEGLRRCRVIGALFLIQDATIVGGQRITGGVYLLAYSPDAERVMVVETRVSGDGCAAYRPLGGVKLENSDTGRGAREPYIGVWFPTEELLADDNPYNRVTADLVWKQESYMFRVVDMDFICL